MAQNFLNAFKNTKTRTLVLVVGSTLVAGVIFLVANLKGGKDPAKENPSKVVGVPREAQSVPGTQTSEQYRKLLAEENKKRAEEAEKEKKSALPTFKGAGAGTDPNNPFGVGGAGGPNAQFGLGAGRGTGNDPFGDTSRGGFVGGGAFNAKDQQRQLEEDRQKRLDEQKKRLAELEEDKRRKAEMEQRRKELEAAEKQYQQSVQEAATQMANYAKGATASWIGVPPQQYIQGIYADKSKNKGKTDPNATDGFGNADNVTPDSATSANGSSKGKNAKPEKELIKAGTVLYAVLDTAINSDEQGPVLATIVSGKYKGARLLGKIQLPTNASKVIITFTTMSLPKKKESLGIDAYAVDPDTARTAFASDVDNHYLLRYGSLFASSFMEGFGKAVGQQGTTTTDPSGSQIQTKPELSTTDQIYTALGTVGEKWSKQVEPLFKTPVTVTVNQGLGVGILFMRDADVSQNASSTPVAPVSPVTKQEVVSNNSNTAATPNK
jgi:type IV secretory pathway VirB10-like protein